MDKALIQQWEEELPKLDRRKIGDVSRQILERGDAEIERLRRVEADRNELLEVVASIHTLVMESETGYWRETVDSIKEITRKIDT